MNNKIKHLILPILVAPVFLGAGVFKLLGADEMQLFFSGFGLPLWFMYLTGAIEVLSAVGLFFSGRLLGFYSAGVLSFTMLIGAGFHLIFDPFFMALPALLLCGVCGFIAFQRRNVVIRTNRLG